MRFGRRNKHRPTAQTKGTVTPLTHTTIGNVATDERDALLGGEEGPDESFGAEEFDAEDSTQRLLTVLGRFQRHARVGATGAPQSQWSDPCMDQLIEATEIAVAENWREVTNALTQTAQILQSYEDAGKAGACVNFLIDSYELLCLMVSDLIVGQVRDGVVRKWRDRYEEAVGDVYTAGIELVPLDGAEETKEQTTEAEPVTMNSSNARKPSDMPFTFPTTEDESDLELTDLPTLDELPPLEDDVVSEPVTARATPKLDPEPAIAEEETHAVAEASEPEAGSVDDEKGIPPEIAQVLDEFCEPLARIDRIPLDRDHRPIFDAMEGRLDILRRYAATLDHAGATALCKTMTALCEETYARKGAHDDRFLELAYAFGGHFVELVEDPAISTADDWMAECDALIAAWRTAPPEEAEAEPEPELEPGAIQADTPEQSGPEPEMPGLDAETEADGLSLIDHISQLEATKPPAPEPAHVVAETTEPEPIAGDTPKESTQDMEEKIIKFQPSAASQSLPRSLPEDLDDDSVASLLATAHGAVGRGDAAQAKLYALQAVAQIAKIEVSSADQTLRGMEARLQQGQEAIESARTNVREGEKRVEKAVAKVAEGESALNAQREMVEAAEKDLETHRGRLADLDLQIQRLQEKREQVAERLQETEQSLDTEQTQQSAREEELESRRAAEEEARAMLEDLRQKVKALYKESTETENDMVRARDDLTAKRMALADIEQTMAQIAGLVSGDENGGEQLFE